MKLLCKSLIICILIGIQPTQAQFSFDKIPVPLNVQDAYENGTRNKTGIPGRHYFQNHTDYKMDVELDFDNDVLSGESQMTYYNNSPDTIQYIIFRLYNNLYKKGVPRLYTVNTEDLHDGISIDDVKVNGHKMNIGTNAQVGYTNGYVPLNKPLMPNESCKIELKWEVELPGPTQRRTGKYFNSSYFIGFWYPQIAVYDDIEGWDMFQFTGQYEFYNDFNNYDLKITAPGDHIVWATGKLQNENQIFSKKILAKIDASRKSDSVVHIISEPGESFTDDKKRKITWHYKVENINDVAIAASNEYLWDASGAPKHSTSNDRVWVNAVYHESSENFKEVADISRLTVQKLANDVYATPFPYHKVVVFNGGSGGMEFPMMINDQEERDYCQTVYLTSHEIAHMYFPFLTGNNERRYAWMDEGLTTFLAKYVELELCAYDAFTFFARRYEPTAGSMDDIPLMMPTNRIMGRSYYNSAYFRSSMALYLLEDYLSPETFSECIALFIERWRGKHPTGYDFFFTIENYTGEDLSWYWLPWFFRQGYPDLSIDTADIKNHRVRIQQVGDMPVPLRVVLYYEDGTKKEINEKMSIWKDLNVYELTTDPDKQLRHIELGHPRIPDVDQTNNVYSF
ncbi:MAG: hypothetical protein GVY19_02035 [Bacteroidetes bacterium]|jgi:hypothetical protein|nr:hypothetical protein [Bacteroidota bacterium]